VFINLSVKGDSLSKTEIFVLTIWGTIDRVEEISQLLLRSRRVRMIGTAATDLAYVACGRADLLVNHSSAPWDREAGKLLLLEAGGKALTKLSRNNEKLSLYSNDFLHQEVENLLFS
jgi:myo-inositol-1(or 4)-monophosphatase